MFDATFKTQREAVGLSVQDVAEAAGVTVRSVQFWETGKTPPPDDVSEWLEDLWKTFGDIIDALDTYLASDDDYSPDRYQAFQLGDDQPLADQIVGIESLEEAMPDLVLLRPRTAEIYAQVFPDLGLPYRAYCGLLGRILSYLATSGWFCGVAVAWIDDPTASPDLHEFTHPRIVMFKAQELQIFSPDRAPSAG